MSTQIKFIKCLAILLLFSVVSFGQASVLELTTGTFNSLSVTGSGFGPRTSDHVAVFEEDQTNNSHFTIFSPTVTATFALRNQKYAAGNPLYPFLPYGATTTNEISTGLTFGAGPSLSTGGNVQQASPLNSWDILGAWYSGGDGGPKNGMFMSRPSETPTTLPYPTQSGSGINAVGGVPGAQDRNAGAEIFTAAQILYNLGVANNSSVREYYGDLVITFNRFVNNPVIHLAGLGGSYRYLPVNALTADTSNYLSTFFTTELELVSPIYSMTKMAGNEFLSVSGTQIKNTCVRPNGESNFAAATNSLAHNNYGAASGSIRINGIVRSVTFKVYLKGSDLSQINWASAGIGVVLGATRAPLTGDIWYVSASAEAVQLIPLPATGLRLTAALNGNDVQLNWKTLSEANSKNFEIERSTDGVNFSAIAMKNAAGDSYTELNYNLVDANMSGTVYYYRIKMVDIDGKYTYSNIAIVRKTGAIKGIRTFPNPAVNQLNVEFSNAKGNYTVSLYNQAGQEVATQRTSINYTVQYVTINRNNLPGGSYILRVRNADNTESFVEKVVLQ